MIFRCILDDYYKWIALGFSYIKQIVNWKYFSNYEKKGRYLLLLCSSLGICLNEQPLFFDTFMFYFENLNSFGNDDIARMLASKYSNYTKWETVFCF